MSVSPALAERESPDKRPQTAVETDRRGHTEDGYDPNGYTVRKQQTGRLVHRTSYDSMFPQPNFLKQFGRFAP